MSTAYKSARYQYEGTETTETSITRVGGATDPTGQAQSRKIASSANALWLKPFKAEPLAIWNPTTGADVTVTVYGIANSSLPYNDAIWLEVEYLGSSSPLGKIVNTTKSNLLAASATVTSDSSTWNNTPSTFDPGSTINTTLSNGNLTATHSNTTSASGARVAGGASGPSGKYYLEITQTTTGHGALDAVGLMSVTGALTDLTSGLNCCSITRGGNVNINNLVAASGLGLFAAGDVCGIAIDFGAQLFWGRRNAGNWNASGTADPATGAGGLPFPASFNLTPAVLFSGGGTVAGDSNTINFGATAYANAAPSGFSNWPVWSPFKLVTTLSSPQPGLAGMLEARVRVGSPSAIFYIDPQIILTSSGGSYNAATAYKSSRYALEGTETTEVSITRVGGAADPTGQVQARKILTTANALWLKPFRAERYLIWNSTTGANVTVTVYGTINAGAVPNNDDIWMEVVYLGSSSSPLGTIVKTTKANFLTTGTAVSADGSTWNGGGSGAGWSPFKLVATLSSPQPSMAGILEARVRVGKPSTTYYLDPQLVLS